MKKILFIIVLGLLLSGCVVDDAQMKQTTTQTGIKINNKIKEIIILNDDGITAKLTIELIKRGFRVKPFASQEKITKKSNNEDVEYNKASARYGLEISRDSFAGTCVFSTNEVYDFIFTLIDLKTNDIVDIFEKKGPEGKCPPLTPIYILYADYLERY